MGFIFIGRIAQAIIALISVRVMTAMLSPEEVGRLSLLFATTSFFVLGLVNPVGMFINRRLHSWAKHGKVERYMLYYFIYLLAISFVAMILIYIGNIFYTLVPGVSLAWLVSLVAVSIVFATLNQTFIPSLNLLGYRGWFVLLTLLTVIASLVASIGMVYYFPPSAELWQVGQLSGQLLLTLIAAGVFFFFAKKHQEEVSDLQALRMTREKAKLMFSFAWPLTIAVLLTWAQTQSYRFIAQDSIGLDALGLFVMGYGISAAIITVFESIISGYFMPGFYKRVSLGDKKQQAHAWANYAFAMLPSLCLMVGLIIALQKELTFILLDESFSSAYKYVLWGALAEAARVIVGTYALLAHAGMDTKKLIVPNVLPAITTPVMIFMLVPYWGAGGVGMGLFAAGVVAILSNYFVLSKSFCIVMPWKGIVQSSMVALFFIVIHMIFQYLWGSRYSWFSSLAWLASLGSVLFIVLYFMLKDAIHREAGS